MPHRPKRKPQLQPPVSLPDPHPTDHQAGQSHYETPHHPRHRALPSLGRPIRLASSPPTGQRTRQPAHAPTPARPRVLVLLFLRDRRDRAKCRLLRTPYPSRGFGSFARLENADKDRGYGPQDPGEQVEHRREHDPPSRLPEDHLPPCAPLSVPIPIGRERRRNEPQVLVPSDDSRKATLRGHRRRGSESLPRPTAAEPGSARDGSVRSFVDDGGRATRLEFPPFSPIPTGTTTKSTGRCNRRSCWFRLVIDWIVLRIIPRHEDAFRADASREKHNKTIHKRPHGTERREE